MWPPGYVATHQRIASTLGRQLMTALNTRTLSRVNVVSPPGVCSEHSVLRVASFELGSFPIASRFHPSTSLAEFASLHPVSLLCAPLAVPQTRLYAPIPPDTEIHTIIHPVSGTFVEKPRQSYAPKSEARRATLPV